MKKFILFLIFYIFVLNSCGGSNSSLDTANSKWYKPNKDTTWQWQLNGKVDTSYSVDLYDIDLFDTPVSTIKKLHKDGKKVICYFSAGSYENWREDASKFPSNVLGNTLDGWEGERWLDISNLKALAPIMKSRLDLAKSKGCDGIEPDNVDGYINSSGFELTYQNQIDYNKFLANQAHKRGLSIALKNDLEQIKDLEPLFDFAINEECHQYGECEMLTPFIKNNKAVFNVEYNKDYIVDNQIDSQLCKKSRNLGLQTLVLPKELDNSFRYSCNPKDIVLNSFATGFGGGDSFKFQDNSGNDIWVSSVDLMLDENIANNSYYQKIKKFNKDNFSKLQSHLKKAKYFSIWITKGWQEDWIDIDSINRATQAGKVPVFIYWYFGDKLADGMPNSNEIKEYYKDVDRLKNRLNKINGIKLLIIEPEFNKEVVLKNSEDFIKIVKYAIDKLKHKETLISLCMTDTGNRGVNQKYKKCGYNNCALGDKYEWSKSKKIYDALLDKIDFISFQEMIGQFSRDPSNPGSWENPNPISYSDDDIGIEYLPKRVENLTKYLYQLYHKPIYLPYIAIATATWQDSNNNGKIEISEIDTSGYEDKAYRVYRDLNKTILKANHLFGYSPMELFDDPRHDYGGYQYFLNNEYHIGVIKSSAVDINDSAANGDIEFKFDLDTIW
jgi:hypothetical protein